MTRFLVFVLILFFSSCQIFNTKKYAIENQVNNMVVYANIETASGFLNELKLKTKINISIDSVSIAAYPIMGLKLGTIVLKDDIILINQKLTNTRDSIIITNTDSQFKLQDFKKSVIQSKLIKDSVFYQNSALSVVFTDYKDLENFFFPQKIIYWTHNTPELELIKNTILVEYKSVKYRNDNGYED